MVQDWGSITLFLYTASHRTNKRLDDYSKLLVGNYGTYAISIQEFGSLSTLLNTTGFQDDLNASLESAYFKADSQEDYEKGLLQTIKDLGVEYGVPGIPLGLYRQNNDGKFEGIELNSSGSLVPKPCT